MDLVTINNNNTHIVEKGALNDLFLKFIDYLDVSSKTLETYTKCIKQLLKYFVMNNIKQPNRSDLISFKEYLLKNNYKATTIQNYITIAKIFFRWTNQESLYPNIAENIKGVKISRDYKKDYLTSNQIKDILSLFNDSYIDLRDKAIFTLMVTTGLRTIEISRANISDIKTLGNSTVIYIQSKGKNDKNDFVKVSAKVEKILRDYLKQRNYRDNDPLFVSTSNNSTNKRLSTRSISAIIKSRMNKAGYISDRLTAHSLRHTAVTLAFLAGKELSEIQQFARHANISTTMIYCHTLDKQKNTCNDAITQAIL